MHCRGYISVKFTYFKWTKGTQCAGSNTSLFYFFCSVTLAFVAVWFKLNVQKCMVSQITVDSHNRLGVSVRIRRICVWTGSYLNNKLLCSLSARLRLIYFLLLFSLVFICVFYRQIPQWIKMWILLKTKKQKQTQAYPENHVWENPGLSFAQHKKNALSASFGYLAANAHITQDSKIYNSTVTFYSTALMALYNIMCLQM